ncbi:MAG: peptide chain release factor N(5)-glutamine methyltransferase [Hyphomicrobiaceae bacterium]|nr:peptide chain release factor N(5)-glutamine methyltransferase [Hyphomicrobiaceae bacterium]
MSPTGDPARHGGESIARAQHRIARALAAGGIAEPAGEARRLVAAALGLTGAQMLSRSAEPVGAECEEQLAAFLQRRLRHEPLSRIVGTREFYGRAFKVTPATLDPRPETETIIEAACALLADARQSPLRLLDIGTGTGAIVLTLLAEFPRATGVATDVSAAALAVALENAQALGLAERVSLVETDLAEGLEGPFDIVVSNPPYVASGDIEGLAREVKDFDPRLALDGGDDGLAVYRRLAQALPALAPQGTILLEVGFNQAEAVIGILESAFVRAGTAADTRTFLDVAGIRRVVAARARSSGYAEKALGFSKPAE